MNLKFKRHYKLILLLALVSTVLIMGLGDQHIVAYSVPDGGQAAEQITSAGSTVALSDEIAVYNTQVFISDTISQ
ncbi:MAG: hypothetical protein ACOYZ7_03815 [Chloroflexota bacterium]